MSDCCASANKPYDLAVVGAGSAGFSAAITAAEEGARVALLGEGVIGGTCVNVGCVPSKTMIRAAEALHGARAASRFEGLVGEAYVADWRRLIGAKDALVADLRKRKYTDLLRGYDRIDYLEGRARLTSSGVDSAGRSLTVGKTVITTGARPAIPPIRDLDNVRYLTSTSLLELERLPQSLIVAGGGFVGVELAQMMARMGTEVTVVCRSRLLPQAEPEASSTLTEALSREGVRIVCGAQYGGAREDGTGVTLLIRENDAPIELKAERLLIATGRTPNVEHLDLPAAGVLQDEHGAIVVDDHMRTTRSGVYAAGDVTGRDQFVYMAAYGAKLAARNALGGDRFPYSNDAMPWVVFTDPQVAGVGLTEAEAKRAGHDVKTSLVPLDQVPRALAARDMRGLIKLVADAKTGRVLGGEIVAPEGADSIQTLVMALKQRMTARQLGEIVFPYLTTVEGLKLAAQAFDRDIHKLSCCAG